MLEFSTLRLSASIICHYNSGISLIIQSHSVRTLQQDTDVSAVASQFQTGLPASLCAGSEVCAGPPSPNLFNRLTAANPGRCAVTWGVCWPDSALLLGACSCSPSLPKTRRLFNIHSCVRPYTVILFSVFLRCVCTFQHQHTQTHHWLYRLPHLIWLFNLV